MAEDESVLYVIKKRGLFYRPGAHGYTDQISEAGTWPKSEAEKHIDKIGGVTISPLSGRNITYYELRPVTITEPEPGEFRMATAAVMMCSLCGGTIDGMGGPGSCPVCEFCAVRLRRGELRGTVNVGWVIACDGKDCRNSFRLTSCDELKVLQERATAYGWRCNNLDKPPPRGHSRGDYCPDCVAAGRARP